MEDWFAVECLASGRVKRESDMDRAMTQKGQEHKRVRRPLPPSNEAQKLLSSLCAISKDAEHTARDRRRAGFLYAAHRHAHVCALYYDGYTLRSESFVKS